MRLAERLLLGALAVVSVFVMFLVAIASERLRDRLYVETTRDLTREAQLVATQWRPGVRADSLADVAGAALGHHVTLSDLRGTVVGDSELDGPAIGTAGNQTAAEQDEIAATVSGPGGVARVSVSTLAAENIVEGAQRDVLVAGGFATLAAMVLAWLFSRSVSRPITELGAVARAVASGDLARRPILAAPGEVGELASALHRMAEQLAARLDTMRQEDALMTALIDSLDEGVLAVDGRRQVVRMNASAHELLGIRESTPFPADRLSRDPVLRAALADALDGRATDGGELRAGDQVLLLTARPLPAGGAVLALLDLTAIRRLETVRRDFVANVSHELKTPLTVISGFAETLAEDDPPAAQRRQFVDAIRANAFRMQRLVDDLLDLSRIESGGWQPNASRIDVEAAIREAAGSVEEQARAKGLRIVTEIGREAATMHADPLAVRQVLANLAENAVRYTHVGQITIFARATPDAVLLGVTDTGVGISGAHLPRIFERFYRADPGRSREVGGTGLGLAIVKHLVEAHGGRVSAESMPGEGTTVAASFPLRA